MVVLSNLPPPSVGIRFQQPQTTAVMNNDSLGSGTLYITESCVSWVSDGGDGFSLEYPAISLHAISRDLSSYAHECIYLMVDAKASERRAKKHKPNVYFTDLTDELAECSVSNNEDLNMQPVANGVQNDDEEEHEEGTDLAEIRFVPLDKTVLDQIFQALADCQQLHPDEDDDFSDEDGGEGFGPAGDMSQFYTSADQEVHLNQEGQANLARILQASGDGVQQEEEEDMETGDAENGQ